MPFLFGLPGETAESINFSVNFAKEIIGRFSNVRMILVSLAIPLVGSSWFQRLISNEAICRDYESVGVSLRTDDVFNYHRLLELSLRYESAISMTDLVDALEGMRKYLEQHVTVGCFGGIDSSS